MKNIENKVVLITGASSGIGAETAKLLAKDGAKVMLAARRADRLKELTDEINQNGGTAAYRATDVTDHGEVAALVQYTLEKFHRIDVLFANAGLMPLSYMRDNKFNEWDQMIDVNLKGLLYAVGEIVPIMEKQGSGQIIATDSIAGHKVFPGNAVYCGTKFAVRAVMNGLRAEEGPSKNIRVTMISPGDVDTELYTTTTDETMKQNIRQSETDRGLVSKDVANAVAYAISQPGNVVIDEVIMQSIKQQG
ncbi:short-chain dehydrogenase reductase SDR [Lactobacillus selangorensis]|uniref:Short-chain dehydrogenase reductase SDR n=1 Tax=Lactobacillus selangorensis TaxID=81857 RepID=A0A0R2FUS3_9LACO|nr:SDR family oxidoreductase [Lactobacillus selangorensis]KRN28589.1 short-chain dehydrogenase reductase SDR [Lactobacillus selangorensis]KRN33001.1 short-chain dehydrogenase reductase SDR [Lactobacillus selangorensis]